MSNPMIDNKQYQFIGSTDTVTQCGCCGKENLKKTIVLQNVESGDFVYYGSTCGARALGWAVKAFNAAAKSADVAARNARQDRAHRINQAVEQHPEIKRLRAITHQQMSERLPFAERRENMLAALELHRTLTAEFEQTMK